MTTAATLRVLVAALPLLAAAGCVRHTPENHASAAERAACRQRAEDIYRRQNRAELTRLDEYATMGRDTPFAGTGVTGSTAGLSAQFAHQRMVDDCLNSAAGNIGSTGSAPVDDRVSPE